MSLPGVESARRRRASHGRSGAATNQTKIRLSKPVASAGIPNWAADAQAGGHSLAHAQAMAARHRLDDKLRAAVPGSSSGSRSSSNGDSVTAVVQRQLGTQNEMQGSSLHGRRPPLQLPWVNRVTAASGTTTSSAAAAAAATGPASRPSSRKNAGLDRFSSVLREGKLSSLDVVAGSAQEECPICLDPFLSRQMLACLSCNHRFHSPCLLPWLQSHSQCPLCRAQIAPRTKTPTFTL